VRAALKELQETINQAAVKSLLKKYGASTLGQLSEKKYQRVIDDAKEQVEEHDD
jgi:Ca2+-binding EF-hand superfamily protein